MIEIDARHQPYEVADLDAGTLLGFLAEDRVREMKQGRRKLRLSYAFAVQNPPTPDRPAAVMGDQAFIANDCEEKLAGEGTPDVALFAAEDLAAAAGMSRPGALALLADTLDLHHRLPRLWKRVDHLEVEAWRARRIALLTRKLSLEACLWFDERVHKAGRFGWPTSEKWLAYALAKFHPEQVKDPNAPVGKGDWGVFLRHPNTGNEEGSNGIGGTSELTAVGDSLDLSRFFDLLSAEAARLKAEGDTDTLDQRRAKALGRLVDDTATSGQGTLDFAADGASADAADRDTAAARSAAASAPTETCGEHNDAGRSAHVPENPDRTHSTPGACGVDGPDGPSGVPAVGGTSNVRGPQTGGPATPRRRGLRVMVHVSLADLLGCGRPTSAGPADDRPSLAGTDRLGQVLVAQLRDWIARHGSLATVTPVVDLHRDDSVDRHDPPEWMDTQVRLRDPHCVYPHCTRSSWDCDLDHIEPYKSPDAGGASGQTRPDALAPLCRRHHLAKTAGKWTYERSRDGTYVWTSRHGRSWLVGPVGTIDITEPD